MKYFLLDFNHASGDVHVAPIEDAAEALAAYSEREGEALGTEHEIVLFYGESEDDLRKTHSRYFIGRKRSGNGESIDLDHIRSLIPELRPVETA